MAESPPILCLGSLCIDNVYRVPHLALPGETLLARSCARFAGGKGLNQSLAAVRAGAKVAHSGAVGEDGHFLREALAEAGVDVSLLAVREQERSGHAILQVADDGSNSIVIVGGTNRSLDEALIDQALAWARREGAWLLLQNEINDLARIMTEAAGLDIPMVLNAAPADDNLEGCPLERCRVLIVNEVEAAWLAATQQPRKALALLAERCPDTLVVLTLGARGLLYQGPEGSGEKTAFAVEAVDETAAGDAFVGTFLAAFSGGLDLDGALHRGAAAGALAVTVAGAATAIPDAAQVDGFLRDHPL